MPLFISYSRQDKDFVDRLARTLVHARARVWLDRWELNVGDSLTQRIQDALEAADALLVVLSPASVASDWCRRELSSGLIRELEEKRVLVLPLLLADCEIPLFLRDKLYADFRTDFDAGFQDVQRAIARITTTTRGRIESPTWHNDWAIDYGIDSSGLRIVITFIESAETHPYTVQIVISAFGDSDATNHYMVYRRRNLEVYYAHDIMDLVAEVIIANDLRQILGTRNPAVVQFPILDNYTEPPGLFSVRLESRLLGEDTGFDALIDVANLLREAQEHVRRGQRPLTDEERASIAAEIASLDA